MIRFILVALLVVSNCQAADWYMVGKIVECESSGRYWVWGDDHRSYGIAQFQYHTFQWMKRIAGMPELEWHKPADQIKLLEWALDNGKAHNWTCWRVHHRYWELHRADWIRKHRNNLLQRLK